MSAVNGTEWRQVPVGPGAGRWITRTGCKTVLMVVHTVTMGQRLTKLLPLFETDQRVQVVFTAGPHAFGNGVARLLRRLDGVVIPWEQATETPFDLALAAGYPSVHELRAPLIIVPHGAAYNKLVGPRRPAARSPRAGYTAWISSTSCKAAGWYRRARALAPGRPGGARPPVPGGGARGPGRRRPVL